MAASRRQPSRRSGTGRAPGDAMAAVERSSIIAAAETRTNAMNDPGPRPRYQMIADDLREAIASQRYAVGAMLPTELELCAHYAVSRYTVRAALRQLREQGMVDMRRGSGTRVTSATPGPAYVQAVSSITELLQYPDTRFETIETGTVRADAALARRLHARPGSRWFRISGLRRSTATGKPVCWQDIHVLPEFEPAARRLATAHSAVHRMIEDEHGAIIAHAQLEMFASRIPAALADRLEVEPGSAAMTIVRRYTGRDGRVIETTVSTHPEDRFVYSLELKRE